MNISYKERQELNTLSKEVFGSSSRWQTIIRKGRTQLLSATPVGRKGKFVKKSKVNYDTFESIRIYMMDLRAQKEAKLAEMKRTIDETNSKA